MSEGMTMTADQVAAALQRSVEWFYDQRSRLERAGFPQPLPGFGRALLYSRERVLAWINDPLRPGRGDDIDVTNLLAQRAAALASGSGVS